MGIALRIGGGAVTAMALLALLGAGSTSPPQRRPPRPKLAILGSAEVVWDQAKHSCPEPWDHGKEMGENGDSVPIAWHNPLTATSYLISSTYRGTYASVGPSLAGALKHDCSHRVYPALLDSLTPVGPAAGPNCSGEVQPGVCGRYQPETYANFQCKYYR